MPCLLVQKKYGNVLSDIESAYEVISKYNPSRVYFYEAVYSIPYNQFLIQNTRLYKALTEESDNEEQLKKLLEFYKGNANSTFEGFNRKTEQQLVSNLLKIYLENVPQEQYSPELMSLYQTSKTDVVDFVALEMEKSIFASKDKYLAFS